MSEQKPILTISEDGKWITVEGPLHGVTHTFELVDHVPLGYSIWNIPFPPLFNTNAASTPIASVPVPVLTIFNVCFPSFNVSDSKILC